MDDNNKKNVIGIVLLVVMFVFFILFRVFYQQGAKLLNGIHPWDYIALVVIVALLGIYLVRTTKKK
ncbi:hypothetical protein [Anaeropeptidivorans aminofermentans]|jgi:hypothetical protein|uniref:hypothetical protein n=1 Tax=Anaeropeptidivorans aminofermentans TaxID=2934315 RepID=UPI00202405F5|nr:hypothetical protein [Anaeropeptidivorans aminofermentans]MBE6011847.1 hypothetical protein [Lachnospiraceae bacterium]